MKSAVESLTPTRVKLSVEVPAADLKPNMDAAYTSIAANVNVPGFRRGKVPRRIIDQRFGRGTVVQEAVNEALGELYTQALLENELRPLGQPELNLTELPLEEGQELKFEAELDIVPAFELADYTGLEVEVDPVVVDEDDVTARLEDLRARFGTLIGVDRAVEDGDFTSIDLAARIGDEEIDTVSGASYQIGSGTMLEGLDEALLGHAAGDTVEFTTPLAGGDRAGEEAEVTVTLQAVKERQLPELDDDFAQLASEFDALAELEADLRAQSERAARFKQGVRARDKVLDKMLEMTQIPVPEGLVDKEVHDHLEQEERLEDDEHRAEVAESTTKALRTQFLLDAVVERDDVEVSQEELIEYLIMAAQESGLNPNDFAQAIDERGQVPAMVAEVGRRKALAQVLEAANITDSRGEVVDLNALQLQGEDDNELGDDELEEDLDDPDLDDPDLDDEELEEQATEDVPDARA